MVGSFPRISLLTDIGEAQVRATTLIASQEVFLQTVSSGADRNDGPYAGALAQGINHEIHETTRKRAIKFRIVS
jgi:hypothetical protein